MIETGDREGVLDALHDICTRALSDRNLSSLKQKFINFSFPEDDTMDRVLRSSIEGEIQQILSAHTTERARHYVRSLMDIASSAGGAPDGLNIRLWKGYDDIFTDSLWNLGARVSDDSHKAWYWGNFVPQIPFQLISRYTSPGDWVLDPFCGSGTTLVEASKLGRNSLGIELNPEVFRRTGEQIRNSGNDAHATLLNEDSLDFDYAGYIKDRGQPPFKLAILHPPYWDIIRFSEDGRDLSNSRSLEDFTGRLGRLAGNILPSMAGRGHIGLVIGDMYRNGEVIPLGFRSMEAFLGLGLKLRGIIVKDIQNTRAKRTSESLWRYRALKSGFYVFKHEYIFVFRLQ